MNKYLAYIDESGDPIIADDASKTLFVGAIVVSQEALPALMATMGELRRRFGLRELKSNEVSNFDRRFAICQVLVDVDLKVLSIWVKKRSLSGDWYKYKQTFYKYVQRRLNHELYRLFRSVQVTIDRYGSPEYQRSFSRYLDDRLQGELFEPNILIGSAKENDLIQVCDFLAGSLRKSLEGDFAQTDCERLLQLLRPVWPVRIQIPDEGGHVTDIPADDSGKELLACMEEARRYLDKNAAKRGDPKIRTLEYLYYSAIDGSNEYIYTEEILGWLHARGLRLSEEQFRTEVTASLRDEGLIIAATRKGIKIPRTADDFREYVAFTVGLVLPVLKRLKKAIVFVSENTDLLDAETLLSPEMQRILHDVDSH